MSPMKRAVPWMVLGLMGCTDKSGNDTGSSGNDTNGDGTIYSAQEGDWTLAPATIDIDECDLGDQLASGDEQPLTVAAMSAGLELTFEGMDGWDCSQTDNSIACDDQVLEETDLKGNGLDAVITQSMGLSGRLTSDTSMKLSLSAFYDCEGADCEAVIEAEDLDIPCTTTLSSTATAD